MAMQDEYEQLLYRLLPPGPAWEGEIPLIEGLAPSLTRVHQRADALMKEIDPAQTTELIDRYETVYGLPDSCTLTGCNRWSSVSNVWMQRPTWRAVSTNSSTVTSWTRWVIPPQRLNSFRTSTAALTRNGGNSGAITGV